MPGGVQEEFAPNTSVIAVPTELARDQTGWLCLSILVAAFTTLYFRFDIAPADVRLVAHSGPAHIEAGIKPSYRESFVSNGVTLSSHSASGVEDGGGNIRVFWFGGTREGARDAAIYTSVSTKSGWTPERVTVQRELVQQQLGRYISKLGNPVAARDARGRLWLFFVSVSVGGWAGSAINAIVSHDGGQTWGPARRFVTSPFFNISTLVKGAPVYFADDTIGLPVYHEFIGKFGELIRHDLDGNVVAKTRLSWGRHSLQPAIVARSPNEALGFMRYAGEAPKRVLMFRSIDGIETWEEPRKINLPNPNSAVAALALQDGGVLLAFNDSENSRSVLSLAHSSDAGKTWRVLHSFERSPAETQKEFSYPWLLRDKKGQFHVFYTWSRKRIKHVTFNSAWLKQKL
jgi:predicted neuraminidase